MSGLGRRTEDAPGQAAAGAPSGIVRRSLAVPDGAPTAILLDGTAAEANEEQLRAAARAMSAQSGARYSSRSYACPLALVAAHDRPVGVDLERIGPCDERFADSISTPEERALWAVEDDRDRLVTSLWSSKEALSKALGDALDYDPRRLGSPMLWPAGRSGSWRACPLDLDAEHVAWLCWRTDEPEGARDLGAPV
ncbi:MAG: 4'-phosphopantetheinyl transferase family protein [Solirubrobacteraceae bacterium]